MWKLCGRTTGKEVSEGKSNEKEKYKQIGEKVVQFCMTANMIPKVNRIKVDRRKGCSTMGIDTDNTKRDHKDANITSDIEAGMGGFR